MHYLKYNILTIPPKSCIFRKTTHGVLKEAVEENPSAHKLLCLHLLHPHHQEQTIPVGYHVLAEGMMYLNDHDDTRKCLHVIYMYFEG